MEGAEPVPQKREPVSVMFIKRGGRDIKIGLYSPPDIDDSRPFIPRELEGEGRVFELDLDEQYMGEILFLKKPTGETLNKLRERELENNSAKRR